MSTKIISKIKKFLGILINEDYNTFIRSDRNNLIFKRTNLVYDDGDIIGEVIEIEIWKQGNFLNFETIKPLILKELSKFKIPEDQILIHKGGFRLKIIINSCIFKCYFIAQELSIYILYNI